MSDFVLSSSEVAGAAPRRWLLATHGIFGAGGNLRSLARQLVDVRPDWGLVLADLRNHGRSLAAPPPHTVSAAASDVVALAQSLALQGKTVHALLGHSFGGKVMLLARQKLAAELQQTWVLDATPSARPGAMDEVQRSVPRILRLLEALPPIFNSRAAFVDHLAGDVDGEVAQWLAMNLRPSPEGLRLQLDLAAIRSMLADYYELDLWPEVASGPGIAEIVVAGRSQVFDEDDRRRLHDLAEANAAVKAWTLPDAGHWVHVGARDQLVALLTRELL